LKFSTPSSAAGLLLWLAACEYPSRGAGHLALVLVNPVSTTVQVGDRLRLLATPMDSAGAPMPPGPIVWLSSDTTRATVTTDGVVRGLDTGTVRISARSGETSGWASVTLTRSPPGAEVLVGAGDIADCSTEEDQATARLLDSIPGTVFTAGDDAYPSGSSRDFADCYGPAWGRHRARTRPSPGNHDHRTAGAAPYFAYFGDRAPYNYYSYDLGAWHIISLDGDLDVAAGSPQERWLRADLAATSRRCTLAYWHEPRFSSGTTHGSDAQVQPLWQALYDAGAELVLAGHDHEYERFAPQTPTGEADPVRGIREFVVGTGGADLYRFGAPLANSEARNSTAWGVLKLVLNPGAYTWQFIPVAGGTFSDSGTASCH